TTGSFSAHHTAQRVGFSFCDRSEIFAHRTSSPIPHPIIATQRQKYPFPLPWICTALRMTGRSPTSAPPDRLVASCEANLCRGARRRVKGKTQSERNGGSNGKT